MSTQNGNAKNSDVLGLLLDMRNGQVVADVNNNFNEVVQSVLETGMKGELIIKLMVRPSKMAMGGTVVEVEMEHECKMKRPVLPVGKSTFFVLPDGRLSREHPDQLQMYEEQAKEAQRG